MCLWKVRKDKSLFDHDSSYKIQTLIYIDLKELATFFDSSFLKKEMKEERFRFLILNAIV